MAINDKIDDQIMEAEDEIEQIQQSLELVREAEARGDPVPDGMEERLQGQLDRLNEQVQQLRDDLKITSEMLAEDKRALDQALDQFQQAEREAAAQQEQEREDFDNEHGGDSTDA